MKKHKLIRVAVGLILCFGLFYGSPGKLTGQENTQPELPTIYQGASSGKFEIGIFYSFWSLDFIKSAFEGVLIENVADEISNEIISTVRDIDPLVFDRGYEEDMVVDTGGGNFGLELRYYPQGREGGFSFGLMFEKTKMRLTLEGSLRQNFSNGTYADTSSFGEVVMNPFFTTLSFKWDLKPDWIVTPYFTTGIGLAALNGTLVYNYSGEYKWGQINENIAGDEEQTLKEAEESMSVNLPNILPLLQFDIGVRAELAQHLVLKAEAGFWNGFILRFGIAGRF